jgi:hypothetical protein
MPDNSGVRILREVLRAGRKPKALPPTVPYRVEEWGKGHASFREEGKAGRIVSKRGPPPMGTLAAYIGEKAKLPPRDPIEAGFTVRIVAQGFAYSEKEANDRVNAFISARQAQQIGKARQRAEKNE